MSRPKVTFLVPIVLLLVRSLVPVVHGQILPLEWSHKISDPVKLHNMQQSVLSNADKALLSNHNKYWSDQELLTASPDRGLVNIPALMHKNAGLHFQQQVPPNLYLLLNEQKYLSPHGLPMPPTSGVDVQEALNSKLSYQQPKKRQSEKETDISFPGSGPLIDYSFDDDTSAQPVQPPGGPYPEDFVQSSPYKTRMITRQPIIPSGLARYLFFSTIKRARDGYICHFKLCQVGVSGKRLSNSNM